MGVFFPGQGTLRLRHAHRDGSRIQGARLFFPAAQDTQEEIGSIIKCWVLRMINYFVKVKKYTKPQLVYMSSNA